MKKNQIMNIMIAVLIIASLFQTGKLWLNNSLSRDFFYMFFSKQSTNTGYGDVIQNGSLLPSTVNINFGNEKYERLLIDARQSSHNLVDVVSEALKDCLDEGIYLGTGLLDYEELLSYRSVMYEYGMEISAYDFLNHINVKNNTLAQRIGTFDTVVAIPSRTNSGELTVYFINNRTKKTEKVGLENYAEGNSRILNTISSYQRDQSIFYIATTQQRQFDSIFNQNVFVPQWTDTPLLYENAPIEATSFQFDGSQDIYRFITPFISSNAIQWEHDAGDSYVFSNETTVITIFQNGLFQYENYSQAGAGLSGYSLLDSYAVCQTFLSQDISLLNSIYLTKVEVTENLYTFYFDYYWEQFPICLSETLKEELGMVHSLEVTVENDTVVLYKKYIAFFSKDNTDQQIIMVDFITALNQLFYEKPAEDILVNKMFVGYKLDEGRNMYLSWFIDVNGDIYEAIATEGLADGYE